MRFNILNSLKLFLFVIFLSVGSSVSAQSIKVTGIVSDNDGPIIGANVITKGAKTGVITDENGRFTINVPSNGVLVISYIGYEAQTVNINGKTTIKVLMRESLQNLDEVVVVGYGTQTKRDITGSIVSVNAKEIEKSSPINLASALQGKVSGLDIMSSSEPGSGSTYRIRGTSTLSDGGSTPLFIVDGMEAPNIDNLNPRDIASVEVLKDAASTAIYGSKSANGVIIITTKEGNSSKPKVSISYSIKQSQLSKAVPQMSRIEGIRFETLRNYNGGNYTAIANRDSLNPEFIADNNYQALLFKKAYTQQTDVSISGAEKKLKYFISAGYLDEEGIQINTYNRRMSSRVNIDYAGTSKLTIGNRFAFTLSDQRMADSYSSRSNILSRPANYNVIEPDGTYTPVISSRINPFSSAMLIVNNNKIYEISLNDFVEYKFLPELKFRASISGNLNQRNYVYFAPAVVSTVNQASSRNSNRTTLNWTQDDVLTYSKIFNKNHAVTILGGFSYMEAGYDYTQLFASNNISDGIQTSNAYGAVNASQTFSVWSGNRLASFFGRGSYSYKGRYLFNSNIRYDGSSRFGSNKRWGLFPSASAGWRFSDEKFFKWAKPALKDAKFRLSYGVTGNQNAGDFASLGVYSTSFYADYLGMSPAQIKNPELGWEQTQQLNAGLDLTFLDGRINFVVDYYKKQTSDVLYLSKIPQTNGFKTTYMNIGKVDNNGLELSFKSTNIRTKDFEWTTSLNLFFNKNMIASIPDGGAQYVNGVYILDKGYAVSTIYGWKRKAVFQYNESNAFTPDWQQLTPLFDGKDRFTGYQLNGQTYTGTINQMHYGTASGNIFKGGDVMWDDVNKDGVIDNKDRQVLGCGQPDVMGGFNTEFSYKNFTVSAFFSFALGGTNFNQNEYLRSNNTASAITRANPVTIANTWMAPGDVAFYPIANTSSVENYRQASSLWIEDASYIRLKNLRFNYKIPTQKTKFLGIESANVYLLAQDFFTWSNYSGFDAEIPSSGFSVGYDNYAYPKAKSILLGVSLNF
jgi:TonB-linked SusC/RagA family outer membrane protein